MKIELWSEGKLFQTTSPMAEDSENASLIASDKIMNAARKYGITIWF